MSTSVQKPKLVTITSTSPSSRVILRSPYLTDADNLFTRAKDPKCNTYLAFLASDACTLDATIRGIQSWLKTSYIDSLVLLIVNKSTGNVIGDTGFQFIDFKNKTGELGIMIDSDPAIRGNGYAVEILDLQFAYAFGKLGLETVTFGTSKENVPMREVLKRKLGLEERYREKEDDYEYVADRAWWDSRKVQEGIDWEVVENIWSET